MGTTRMLGMAALLAFAANADAAKWGPTWSELSGELYSMTQMHRTVAIIKRVDGEYEGGRVVKLVPGKRTIIVQSPTRKGTSGTEITMTLDIEPCKRYYINAQFDSAVGRDWEPVLAKVEKITGCKVPPA